MAWASLDIALKNAPRALRLRVRTQTNGIVERFHKTLLNEFYRVAFCKKTYRFIEELHEDLDAYLVECNQALPHQGRWCFGKTPMQTFEESLPLAKEKMLAA